MRSVSQKLGRSVYHMFYCSNGDGFWEHPFLKSTCTYFVGVGLVWRWWIGLVVTGESTSLYNHFLWCLSNLHTTVWSRNPVHKLTPSVAARAKHLKTSCSVSTRGPRAKRDPCDVVRLTRTLWSHVCRSRTSDGGSQDCGWEKRNMPFRWGSTWFASLNYRGLRGCPHSHRHQLPTFPPTHLQVGLLHAPFVPRHSCFCNSSSPILLFPLSNLFQTWIIRSVSRHRCEFRRNLISAEFSRLPTWRFDFSVNQ